MREGEGQGYARAIKILPSDMVDKMACGHFLFNILLNYWFP
jgi:hypothetical protein